ncbi:hypothetical protein V8C42DRAFT_348672 [Trichoderma barbatum]
MDPRTPKSHRRRSKGSTVKKWKEGIPIFETGQHPESSLPFSFGVEFELQLRLKTGDSLGIGNYPAPDASFSVMRRFDFSLLESIAKMLTQEGMETVRHDLSSDGPMDYTKRNVVLDGSLSKAHMKDGYYPVEFVTPVILGDGEWAAKIDKFWASLLSKFEVLLDTTSDWRADFTRPTLSQAAWVMVKEAKTAKEFNKESYEYSIFKARKTQHRSRESSSRAVVKKKTTNIFSSWNATMGRIQKFARRKLSSA